MMDLMHDNDVAVELTESELTEVIGGGALGACGACGLTTGFGFTPFVTAFNVATAFNVGVALAVNVGVANNIAFATQFA
jgi:hypothetical protein